MQQTLVYKRNSCQTTGGLSAGDTDGVRETSIVPRTHDIFTVVAVDDVCCPPSCCCKIEIFQKALHYEDTCASSCSVCVGIGHTVSYYNFRVFFLVKCKNSLDDCAQHCISFSQLEIVE